MKSFNMNGSRAAVHQLAIRSGTSTTDSTQAPYEYCRAMSTLGRRIARSRLAPIAALPLRIRAVGRYDGHVFGQSVRWLLHSREHTNFTYDLTLLNREHLAWWIAGIAGVPVAQVRGYMSELETDEVFVGHIATATHDSHLRGIADASPRPGRRLGWYALIRCLQPEHIVETGTEKGLGSCVAAAALLRNGKGRLTTVDVNPDAGFLIRPPYSDVIELRIGESLDVLRELSSPVCIFFQDSFSTFEHELSELEAVTLTGSRLLSHPLCELVCLSV
jgi:hypothetical protein